MSLNCNFSESDDNCSVLFVGIPVSITALQACFAAAIVIISIPMNIFMIVAMIVYHRLLNKAFIISISFLVSNTIVAVFYSSQVFVTSVTRAWVFGYWGCQIFAIVTIIGRISRWIAIGLLSINMFSKVFFPFSHPAKVLAGILVSAWVFSLIVGILLHFGNIIGFDISDPGCSFAINFSSLNRGYFVAMIIMLLFLCFTCAILPSILYIVIYLKARSLRKVQPVREVPSNNSETVESQRSSIRVNFTYPLLLLSFLLFAALIVTKIIIRAVFMQFAASRTLLVALFFLASNMSQAYLIADLGILLMNKDERKVLCKLLGRVSKLLSCGKGNI